MKRKILYTLTAIFICFGYIFFELKRVNGLTTKECCNYIADFCTEATLFFLKAGSITEKDKLDSAAESRWQEWKNSHRDTTKCIMDFANYIPVEWDTLVYFNHYKPFTKQEDAELVKYAKSHNIQYGSEGLHFLKDREIVHCINLEMASEKEKGVFFGTRKNIIKRTRNNAKFHLEKKNSFFILRDTTEGYVPTWRYVKDDIF